MELWIRSQDKKRLYNCKEIMIEHDICKIPYRESKIGYDYEQKDCWYVCVNSARFGRYLEEERALEVLDEIQNIIILQDMYKYDKEALFTSWENMSKEEIQEIRRQLSVYEMPKE